jgi:hypothetical protein
VQYNTKHDLFAPADALRIGGWEVDFGVGYNCNWNQFLDAGTGSFVPSYVDPATTTGTTAITATRADPLFKAPDTTATRTTVGPVYNAGSGGGDYRLQRISEGDAANSPCLTIAEETLLPGFGTVIGAYP